MILSMRDYSQVEGNSYSTPEDHTLLTQTLRLVTILRHYGIAHSSAKVLTQVSGSQNRNGGSPCAQGLYRYGTPTKAKISFCTKGLSKAKLAIDITATTNTVVTAKFLEKIRFYEKSSASRLGLDRRRFCGD